MKQTSTTETPMPMHLPPQQHSGTGSIDTATLELLASWRIQDATNDPEQLRAAAKELEEFKKAMNENRAATGERILYP